MDLHRGATTTQAQRIVALFPREGGLFVTTPDGAMVLHRFFIKILVGKF